MRWTEADFKTMSWHDNHVHALEIHAGDEEAGTGTLVLHLGYILEWLLQPDRTYHFRIAPAVLTFHGVFGLRVDIDYAGVQAATIPFSISGIGREPLPHGDRWEIGINWPEGVIAFNATGFVQELVGDAVVTDHQRLPSER